MPVLFKNPLPYRESDPPSLLRRIADAAEALFLLCDGLKFLSILAQEPEE